MGGVVSHYFGDFHDVISAPLMTVVGIYTFLFFFTLWGYDRLVLSCVQDRNLTAAETDTKKST